MVIVCFANELVYFVVDLSSLLECSICSFANFRIWSFEYVFPLVSAVCEFMCRYFAVSFCRFCRIRSCLPFILLTLSWDIRSSFRLCLRVFFAVASCILFFRFDFVWWCWRLWFVLGFVFCMLVCFRLRCWVFGGCLHAFSCFSVGFVCLLCGVFLLRLFLSCSFCLFLVALVAVLGGFLFVC